MASPALAFSDALQSMHVQVQQDPVKLRALRAFQVWQSQRLARTYADLAGSPRYGAAMRFFLQDLYGPHDLTQRNRDLRKVLAQWEHRLPQQAYQAVLYALELEVLTLRLDLSMLAALQGSFLTESAYASAYRQVGQRAERQRQIWLVAAAGRALDGIVRLPMIGTALRLASIPARLAGVTVLHQFLERGYAAFQHMGGAAELLSTIEQRETLIMQRLFAGVLDPLQLNDSQLATRCS